MQFAIGEDGVRRWLCMVCMSDFYSSTLRSREQWHSYCRIMCTNDSPREDRAPDSRGISRRRHERYLAYTESRRERDVANPFTILSAFLTTREMTSPPTACSATTPHTTGE
jgi:hypothetical protein